MDAEFLDARKLYEIVWWEWFAEALADVAGAYADWKLARYAAAA
jgi:hypothetical protein